MEIISYSDIPLLNVGETFSCFRLIQQQSEAAMLKSIKSYGQLNPVVVGRTTTGNYEMIDGFKRLRSIRHLRGDSIKARVIDGNCSEFKVAIIQLNLEGRSIRDMEVSMVLKSLHRDEGLSQVQIARNLGHHKSWVSRRISMAEKLSEEVFENLRVGLINSAQGRELMRLPRCNQLPALYSIIKHRLTSRETRRLVGMLLEYPEHKHDTLQLPTDILDDRQSPKQLAGVESPLTLTAALTRLQKSCTVVNTGIDNNVFSDPSPLISEVVKTLEVTITSLKELALKGTF